MYELNKPRKLDYVPIIGHITYMIHSRKSPNNLDSLDEKSQHHNNLLAEELTLGALGLVFLIQRDEIKKFFQNIL